MYEYLHSATNLKSLYKNPSYSHCCFGCNGKLLAFIYIYLVQKPPDIYTLQLCICSSRDRLGFLCGDSDYFWDSVFLGQCVSGTVCFLC